MNAEGVGLEPPRTTVGLPTYRRALRRLCTANAPIPGDEGVEGVRVKFSQLAAACSGQNDQTIRNLIRGTDEYQTVVTSGTGTPRDMRNMFNAGVLVVRGDRTIPKEAMIQAAEQGMVADGATKMAESGQTFTWVPSGPLKEVLDGRNDSFVKFLDSGTDLALDDQKTTFNCWEAVVIAAIIGGVITNGTGLVTLYQESHDAFGKALTQALVTGAGRAYTPGSLLDAPVCGDIVLFDGLAHVAIATGRSDSTGTEVLSFWPAPVKSAAEFGPHGTPTQMLLTTIEALGAWMNLAFHQVPKITFGSPDWQALNLK